LLYEKKRLRKAVQLWKLHNIQQGDGRGLWESFQLSTILILAVCLYVIDIFRPFICL
jgi:hypothetical protein